jgi:hypothetical protein
MPRNAASGLFTKPSKLKTLFYYPSVTVELHTFHFQESPFHLQTAAESAQRTVTPDHPVTGNDNGKWISGQGRAYRPRRPRMPQPASQVAIGADLPPRYLKFQTEDMLLKDPAGGKVQLVERKHNRIALKTSPDPADDLLDGIICVINGAGKGFLDHRLHIAPLRRQKYTDDKGTIVPLPRSPDQADFPKN